LRDRLTYSASYSASYSMASSIFFAFLAFFLVSSTLGHSQMRCANYDMVSGNCLAPIRDQGVAFDQEANLITAGLCQSPMSDPITLSYSNGVDCGYAPCPLPMGTFQQGENFTIMWLARNHAEADETPGNIVLYMSPVESLTQGADVSEAVFQQDQLCQAPFMSCNGQNGDLIQCYATCQMPPNAAIGIHTLLWMWVWPNHGVTYTTCADIYVDASTSGSSPVVASTTTTTAQAAVVTSATTTSQPTIPSTTSRSPTPSTTAPAPVHTTGTTTAQAIPMSTSTTHAPVSTPMTTAANNNIPISTSTTGAAPTPSSSSTSSSQFPMPCIIGHQMCDGSNHYRTCTNDRNGNGYWAPDQSCQVGLTCHPSATGLNIYCY